MGESPLRMPHHTKPPRSNPGRFGIRSAARFNSNRLAGLFLLLLAESDEVAVALENVGNQLFIGFPVKLSLPKLGQVEGFGQALS